MLMLADSPATRAWFVADFVPEILEVVLDTWTSFRRAGSIRLEPRITSLFSDALERAYEEQDKRWFIVPEMKRTDPNTGKELARHDIRFYHRDVSGQRLYFIFECKRLNVRNKRGQVCTNSSSYVIGMIKFVSETYGAGHPAGGMIGYTMDGNISSALQAIKKRINKKRSSLQILQHGDYAPSSSMLNYEHNGETKHRRSGGDFVLYHLLLPVK